MPSIKPDKTNRVQCTARKADIWLPQSHTPRFNWQLRHPGYCIAPLSVPCTKENRYVQDRSWSSHGKHSSSVMHAEVAVQDSGQRIVVPTKCAHAPLMCLIELSQRRVTNQGPTATHPVKYTTTSNQTHSAVLLSQYLFQGFFPASQILYIPCNSLKSGKAAWHP